MDDNTAALIEAMNHLITSADAAECAKALDAMRFPARAWHVQFYGPMSVLNPWLLLERKDPERANRMRRIVDNKRRSVGLPALWDKAPASPKAGTRSYMRDYMKQRRQRLRRAVDIANMQRPAKDRIIGANRLEFERVTHEQWTARLNKILDDARERALAEGHAHLPKDESDELRDAFWAGIDREMDAAEEKALAAKPR